MPQDKEKQCPSRKETVSQIQHRSQPGTALTHGTQQIVYHAGSQPQQDSKRKGAELV